MPELSTSPWDASETVISYSFLRGSKFSFLGPNGADLFHFHSVVFN